MGCLNGPVPAGCAAERTTTSICDAVSENMCCLYGDNSACSDNKFLADYTGTYMCLTKTKCPYDVPCGEILLLLLLLLLCGLGTLR